MAVSFEQARSIVSDRVRKTAAVPDVEQVPLQDATGRVLAEPALADRDYPPVSRSTRDGFAVRASDLPGTLSVVGEVRAGISFSGTVGAGEAVEIMTGATVPDGANQVVMVEHVVRRNGSVATERPPTAGEFINPRGVEAQRGQTVVPTGQRIDFAGVAWLATTGRSSVAVYRKPRVAILATGDEIVGIEAVPEEYQVRNSNSYALAAQVERAGGVPIILPVARDDRESIHSLINRGLEADLLLLSGGVSAGKFDLVEPVLAEFGAEFYFDRVLIQPGQPLVFGRANNTFFFGLPGNPASTMVTFELFARLAIELIGGELEPRFPLFRVPLGQEFRHKPGLTRFLPAKVQDGMVYPVHWQGSSDVPALVRANAFLAAAADREYWSQGDTIGVLSK